MKSFPLLMLIMLLSTYCSNMNREEERIVVANAGERYLYLDQVPSSLFVQGMNVTDSISALQNYIRRWARKELVAVKAEQNLTAEYKAAVTRQLAEMKNNLLIYQYQQQMIIEKMDTAVTDSELQEYYVSNLNTFTLTNNIVKALFIKLPVDAPDIDKVRRWYRSNTPGDISALEDYCYKYAVRYDDFNEEWIPFTQLLMEVPLESDNQESWLKRYSYTERTDNKYLYFINIREYKLRNTVAPFEYISGQVKTIILNTRRNDFLQKLEDGIYNEAVRNNTLKVY